MRKPANKSAAVRQQKAPQKVEADDPLAALYRSLSYFPTPPWAGRAGAEMALRLCPQIQSVKEPACGEGHMAYALADYFPKIIASDIHPFGYGEVEDFLGNEIKPDSVDFILTNPPFPLASAFIERGLLTARLGVGMLCRIALLEGGERYPQFYTGQNPLTVLCPFIERVPMFLGAYDPDGAAAACYAFFFFIKGKEPRPIMPIPPGTKDRLFRAEDVRRFAKMAPAPLLDGVDA